MTLQSPPIKRALISVSDKLGLGGFAAGLAAAGVELYSTGGTRRFLESRGTRGPRRRRVHRLSRDDGRPREDAASQVHGGILARHDRPDDMAALAEHGILTFELVVVNLYPFEATVARPDVTLEEAIEQIDIGGPSLIRAAAKNHAFITVATDPAQYARDPGADSGAGLHDAGAAPRSGAAAPSAAPGATTRRSPTTCRVRIEPEPFPEHVQVSLRRIDVLRYGENPHQQAALYAEPDAASRANLVAAQQLAGKELSYNNLLDLDSALAIVRSFAEPAAVVIKHNNPCGAATADTLAAATQRRDGRRSAERVRLGLGFNRAVDAATAEVLAEPGLFIEAIVAPDFEPQALEILTTRPKWKANVRLMEVGPLAAPPAPLAISPDRRRHARAARRSPGGSGSGMAGGHLRRAARDQWNDLRFAWTIVRHVKSNAIVLADRSLRGGRGRGPDEPRGLGRDRHQESRRSGAGERAGLRRVFSVRRFDRAGRGRRHCGDHQPGGSRRDDEVIAACNEHRMPMIFTGRRHFKH